MTVTYPWPTDHVAIDCTHPAARPTAATETNDRPTRMNKTEAAYAALLEARRHCGEVLWFGFEALKLRLAEATTYMPDFIVIAASGQVEAHEVKGFWRDDARVKFKVAAELFPWVKFMAVRKLKGGAWGIEALPYRGPIQTLTPSRSALLPEREGGG